MLLGVSGLRRGVGLGNQKVVCANDGAEYDTREKGEEGEGALWIVDGRETIYGIAW